MLSLYRLFLLKGLARAGSLICLVVVVMFCVGEGFNPRQVAWREWVGLLFFPVGVMLGLMVAWRWEGLGGVIAVGSLIAFYLIYGWWLSGELFQGLAFLVFTTPAFLFLIDWLMAHRAPIKQHPAKLRGR